MDTLIGVLLDVSGSMKSSFGERPNTKEGSWARSIFKVVDGLIKHDVSSSNHVFALGFGASRDPEAFDLLNTLAVNIENRKMAQIKNKIAVIAENEVPDSENTEPPTNYYDKFTTKAILQDILSILEKNGAPRVRRWALMDVLLDVISKADACLFHEKLTNDYYFRIEFARKCLPEACRELKIDPKSLAKEGSYIALWAVDGVCSIARRAVGMDAQPGYQEYATESSVREAMREGKKLMKQMNLSKRTEYEEAILKWKEENREEAKKAEAKRAEAEAKRAEAKRAEAKRKECVLVGINPEAVMNVHKASDILHEGMDEDELTDQRVDGDSGASYIWRYSSHENTRRSTEIVCNKEV